MKRLIASILMGAVLVNIGLTIVIVLVILVVVWAVVTYNRLVALRNRVSNAWGQVEVQLQRRLDLLDNVVGVAQHYAKHESKVLAAVAEARQATKQNLDPKAHNVSEAPLMPTITALSEAYPELKSNELFLDVQRQLAETEDKISYMRLSYNDVASNYNTSLEQFPSSVIAKVGGFAPRELFDALPAAAAAPHLDL